MGFCTDDEYRRFLHQAPIFERMLVEEGIAVRKYWFSVSHEEQDRRFHSRLGDPLRQWKLSPMDVESIKRWEDYSRAKDEMFVHTDIYECPWYVVEADDKRRARINMIAHLLSTARLLRRPGPEDPQAPQAPTVDGVRASGPPALSLRPRPRRHPRLARGATHARRGAPPRAPSPPSVHHRAPEARRVCTKGTNRCRIR